MINGRDLEGGNGGLFQVVSWYDETIENLSITVDCEMFYNCTGLQSYIRGYSISKICRTDAEQIIKIINKHPRPPSYVQLGTLTY
jgi:hypothetical protein